MKRREKHSLTDDALHADLHSNDSVSDVGSSSRSPSPRHRRAAIQSVAWAAVAATLYITHAIYGDGGTAGVRVRRGGGNLEDKVGARDASPVLNVTIGRTTARRPLNASAFPKKSSRGPIAGKLSLPKINTDGNFQDLLSDFESAERNWLSQDSRLPETAEEIAERYSIPQTDGPECQANTTTSIGWIPCKECNSYQAESGRISRFVFQTWATLNLSPSLCSAATAWSEINPEYDYFLFDDKAIESFIWKEFGERTLESYKCLMVGAAKADFWRLCIVYVFGGIYFDIDAQFKKDGGRTLPFRTWGFGNRSVVTGKACGEIKWLPNGCAHQWAMIYERHHPVIREAIIRSLKNLARRSAVSAYDVSFWPFHLAWAMGPFNQSYMPVQVMDGRVIMSESILQKEMRNQSGDHWSEQLGRENMWRPECLAGAPPVQHLRLHSACKRTGIIAEGHSLFENRACNAYCSSQVCV